MIASARREYFVNRVMRLPPAPLIAILLLGSARKTRGTPATNGQNRGHSPAGEVADRDHIGRLAFTSRHGGDPGRADPGRVLDGADNLSTPGEVAHVGQERLCFLQW